MKPKGSQHKANGKSTVSSRGSSRGSSKGSQRKAKGELKESGVREQQVSVRKTWGVYRNRVVDQLASNTTFQYVLYISMFYLICSQPFCICIRSLSHVFWFFTLALLSMYI